MGDNSSESQLERRMDRLIDKMDRMRADLGDRVQAAEHLSNSLADMTAQCIRAEHERDEARAEADRMRGEIRAVFDRCTTAVALGCRSEDVRYRAPSELADELLGEIEGSPALDGFEYDDPEPVHGGDDD